MSIHPAALSDDTQLPPPVRSEIVFIDPGVDDIDVLLAGLRPEVEGVVLDAVQPAPRQMAQALAGRRGLAAIHVIAHGAPGKVQFSAGALSVATMADHASDLAVIGRGLRDGGTLALWSCDAGMGAHGTAFVDALSGAAGAAVAAAAGRVGAAAKGGSWELAVTAEAPLTASTIKNYAGVMPITGATISAISPDTGILSTDFTTSVTTLTITGTVTVLSLGAPIYIWLDDTLMGSINIKAAQSSWSYNATGKIPATGSHTISVTKTNSWPPATGNLLASHSLIIDTTAPTLDSVTDSPDRPNLVSGQSTTLILHFNDPVYVADGASITLSTGQTINLTANSNLSTTLTVNFTPTSGGSNVSVASITGVNDAAGNTVTGFGDTICFMAGTLIRTPSGEVPVETLQRGDLVIAASGDVAPVQWLGRQTVSTIFADPMRVMPIRIKAGALAQNLPVRDLLVSPDHALLVDGILVHASALVNGLSIVRETNVPTTFVYYHVELADHSLILAEGVPAETFIDNVDRMAFDNWAEHEALYPEGAPIGEMDLPRAKSYRQVPGRIRERLMARAAAVAGAVEQAA
jgi:hypothetical protein